MPTETRLNLETGEIDELEFVPAPRPVPQAVEMAQARLALLAQGITATMVEEKIAEMPSPQREAALIEWEYRTTVRRYSQLVLALGQALGLSEETIDQLFYLAETL